MRALGPMAVLLLLLCAPLVPGVGASALSWLLGRGDNGREDAMAPETGDALGVCAEHPTAAFDALKAWVVAGGGRVDPRLSLRNTCASPARGRGLFVSEAGGGGADADDGTAHVAPGTELAYVPEGLVIAPAPGDHGLANTLLRLEGGWFGPYLDALPAGDGTTAWLPHDLKCVGPSLAHTARHFRERAAATAEAVDALAAGSNGRVSPARAHRALRLAKSRGVRRRGFEDVGIVPVYDLINHDAAGENVVLQRVQGGGFAVVATATIHAGEEVVVAYTDATGDAVDLAYDYGFVDIAPAASPGAVVIPFPPDASEVAAEYDCAREARVDPTGVVRDAWLRCVAVATLPNYRAKVDAAALAAGVTKAAALRAQPSTDTPSAALAHAAGFLDHALRKEVQEVRPDDNAHTATDSPCAAAAVVRELRGVTVAAYNATRRALQVLQAQADAVVFSTYTREAGRDSARFAALREWVVVRGGRVNAKLWVGRSDTAGRGLYARGGTIDPGEELLHIPADTVIHGEVMLRKSVEVVADALTGAAFAPYAAVLADRDHVFGAHRHTAAERRCLEAIGPPEVVMWYREHDRARGDPTVRLALDVVLSRGVHLRHPPRSPHAPHTGGDRPALVPVYDLLNHNASAPVHVAAARASGGGGYTFRAAAAIPTGAEVTVDYRRTAPPAAPTSPATWLMRYGFHDTHAAGGAGASTLPKAAGAATCDREALATTPFGREILQVLHAAITASPAGAGTPMADTPARTPPTLTRTFENLVRWVAGNGGSVSNRVQAYDTGDLQGRGLRVALRAKAPRAGDQLAFIPWNLTVSQSPAAQGSPWAAVAYSLMMIAKNPAHSAHYAPYLATFPAASEMLDTGLHARGSPEQCPPARRSVHATAVRTLSEVEGMTHADAERAMQLALSRSVRVEGRAHLVPVWDLVNHNTTRRNVALRALAGGVAVVATRDIAAGDELLAAYAQENHTVQDFFSQYGFVDPDADLMYALKIQKEAIPQHLLPLFGCEKNVVLLPPRAAAARNEEPPAWFTCIALFMQHGRLPAAPTAADVVAFKRSLVVRGEHRNAATRFADSLLAAALTANRRHAHCEDVQRADPDAYARRDTHALRAQAIRASREYVDAAARAAWPTTASAVKYAALVDWVVAHGGVVSNQFYMHTTEDRGNILKTTRAAGIAKGDILAFIPNAVVIQNEKEARSVFERNLALVEARLERADHYQPYFDILPEAPFSLRSLGGEEYECAASLLRLQNYAHDWTYDFNQNTARIMNATGAERALAERSLATISSRSVGESAALIPIYDLANHNDTAHYAVTSNEHGWVMTATRAIPPDTEVFNYYNRASPESFFHNYGFHNPHYDGMSLRPLPLHIGVTDSMAKACMTRDAYTLLADGTVSRAMRECAHFVGLFMHAAYRNTNVAQAFLALDAPGRLEAMNGEPAIAWHVMHDRIHTQLGELDGVCGGPRLPGTGMGREILKARTAMRDTTLRGRLYVEAELARAGEAVPAYNETEASVGNSLKANLRAYRTWLLKNGGLMSRQVSVVEPSPGDRRVYVRSDTALGVVPGERVFSVPDELLVKAPAGGGDSAEVVVTLMKEMKARGDLAPWFALLREARVMTADEQACRTATFKNTLHDPDVERTRVAELARAEGLDDTLAMRLLAYMARAQVNIVAPLPDITTRCPPHAKNARLVHRSGGPLEVVATAFIPPGHEVCWAEQHTAHSVMLLREGIARTDGAEGMLLFLGATPGSGIMLYRNGTVSDNAIASVRKEARLPDAPREVIVRMLVQAARHELARINDDESRCIDRLPASPVADNLRAIHALYTEVLGTTVERGEARDGRAPGRRSDSNDELARAFRDLSAWLREGGGRLHGGVGFYNTQTERGVGVRVVTAVAEGEELAFIPRATVIGAEDGVEDELHTGAAVARAAAVLMGVDMHSRRGFAPYLDTLPPPHAVGTLRRVTTDAAQCSAIHMGAAAPMTHNSYFNFFRTQSRVEATRAAYYFNLAASRVAFTSDGVSAGMVPFYDMINHNRTRRNVELVKRGNGFAVVATRAVVAGEELYTVYTRGARGGGGDDGAMCVADFYTRFGFHDAEAPRRVLAQMHTKDNVLDRYGCKTGYWMRARGDGASDTAVAPGADETQDSSDERMWECYSFAASLTPLDHDRTRAHRRALLGSGGSHHVSAAMITYFESLRADAAHVAATCGTRDRHLAAAASAAVEAYDGAVAGVVARHNHLTAVWEGEMARIKGRWPDDATTARYRAVYDWVLANGGRANPKVVMQYTQEKGQHMVVLPGERVLAGEELGWFPRRVTLHHKSYKQMLRKVAEVIEGGTDDAAFFAPYAAMFPETLFGVDRLSTEEAACMLKMSSNIKAEEAQYAELVAELVANGYSSATATRAAKLTFSRAVGQFEMVPIFDLHNHNAKLAALFYTSDGTASMTFATRNLTGGEEVFFDYGQAEPGHVLWSYGFHDTTTDFIPLPLDPADVKKVPYDCGGRTNAHASVTGQVSGEYFICRYMLQLAKGGDRGALDAYAGLPEEEKMRRIPTQFTADVLLELQTMFAKRADTARHAPCPDSVGASAEGREILAVRAFTIKISEAVVSWTRGVRDKLGTQKKKP